MPVRSYQSVNGKIRGETQGGNLPLRTTYFHDALGSVIATANNYGVAKNAVRYADWGALNFQNSGWGALRFGRVGASGYRSLGPANTDVYVRARHYSGTEARWTSVDHPHEQLARDTPYSYASSNPVRYTDPSGSTPTYDPPWLNGPIGTKAKNCLASALRKQRYCKGLSGQ